MTSLCPSHRLPMNKRLGDRLMCSHCLLDYADAVIRNATEELEIECKLGPYADLFRDQPESEVRQ
jgi:hypothetical protein